MIGPRARAAWLGLWLLALALLGAYVAGAIKLSGDLRLFLPEPVTLEQQLVLKGIGEGPASRMLLIAIDGDETVELARISRQLVDALGAREAFQYLNNGAADPGAVPEVVTQYRYLLSPAMDDRAMNASSLRDSLQERLQDLASPAATLLEPLIPTDPTLEILAIAESWAPHHAPALVDGVWFDAAGREALLVAQTAAAGFDPDGQQAALEELRRAFAKARGTGPAQMTISGPGQFSALMKQRTQREAAGLGAIATAALLLLLLIAYRRLRVLPLSVLPLASAALVGLACVGLLYGEVHGITLAFGFTLIGVAQDYPIHLFSHQRLAADPRETARHLWPTLAIGMISTCAAYFAFLLSGVTGLAQLGWFTISGLAIAGLTTRYLLPQIIGEGLKDPAESRLMRGLDAALVLPAMSAWFFGAVAAACIAAVFLSRGPFWQDDLGALTPVPRPLLMQYARLQAELGAPDARRLAVITAATEEGALLKLEEVTPALQKLVADGAIGGFEHAARFLPSATTQRRRQARLPDAETLSAALLEAQRGLPFRSGVFDPFLAEVAAARKLKPLVSGDLAASPLGPLLEGLLQEHAGQVTAIVAFSGVPAPERLEQWAATASAGVTLIDLKRAAVDLVVQQRKRILWSLAVAALLLVLVVRKGLGDSRRATRVLAPMVLTTLIVVAVLRVAGLPLDLFHLISLVLAAGLGLDYALFFERAPRHPGDRLRTLHGLLVCALSTLMVFALLSRSQIPVLQSIGLTVALGVVVNFLLAMSLRRAAPAGPSAA